MADPSLPTIPIFHTPYPGIARARAHHLAMRVIERQLQAQGLRVSHIPQADIMARARAYLAGDIQSYSTKLPRLFVMIQNYEHSLSAKSGITRQ